MNKLDDQSTLQGFSVYSYVFWVIILIVFCVSGYVLGRYVQSSEKTQLTDVPQASATPTPTPTIASSSLQSESQSISLLPNLPISFELPAGYAVFQKEVFEGGYGTTISFGREIRDGHFKNALVQIDLLPGVYDGQRERSYQPSEYIQIVYDDQGKNGANPEYIQFLGNEAVRYTNDTDGTPVIVGYLRADQLASLAAEYHIKVSTYSYGSGASLDHDLLDTVINSLQVIE